MTSTAGLANSMRAGTSSLGNANRCAFGQRTIKKASRSASDSIGALTLDHQRVEYKCLRAVFQLCREFANGLRRKPRWRSCTCSPSNFQGRISCENATGNGSIRTQLGITQQRPDQLTAMAVNWRKGFLRRPKTAATNQGACPVAATDIMVQFPPSPLSVFLFLESIHGLYKYRVLRRRGTITARYARFTNVCATAGRNPI